MGALDVFGDEILEGLLVAAGADGLLVARQVGIVELLQGGTTGDVGGGVPACTT